MRQLPLRAMPSRLRANQYTDTQTHRDTHTHTHPHTHTRAHAHRINVCGLESTWHEELYLKINGFCSLLLRHGVHARLPCHCQRQRQRCEPQKFLRTSLKLQKINMHLPALKRCCRLSRPMPVDFCAEALAPSRRCIAVTSSPHTGEEDSETLSALAHSFTGSL